MVLLYRRPLAVTISGQDGKRNYSAQAVVPFRLVGNAVLAAFIEEKNGIRILGTFRPKADEFYCRLIALLHERQKVLGGYWFPHAHEDFDVMSEGVQHLFRTGILGQCFHKTQALLQVIGITALQEPDGQLFFHRNPLHSWLLVLYYFAETAKKSCQRWQDS